MTKRLNHGTTHRIALCQDCVWSDAYQGNGDSIERVARSARSHTEKHGHSVKVETGSSFTYVASDRQ